MAEFRSRKNQRFQDSTPVRYRGHGLAGEGLVENLSLSGGRIRGNVPVTEGMVLELQMALSDSREPVPIERASVQWIRNQDFGVEFQPHREVAERITTLIAQLVQTRHQPPT